MLKIRKDIVFEKPENRIREYCEIEIYYGYDDKHTVDNVLTKDDICNANHLHAMIDRYNPNESANLLKNTTKIGQVLEVVPRVDIFALTNEEWSFAKTAIEKLFAEFLSVDGIGLAKTTKILHLKRPNLFPVLDRLVMMFLLNCDISETSKSRQIELAIEALENTRECLIKQEDAFRHLVADLEDLPIALTPVRIFDILCWSTEKWDILRKLTAPHGIPSKSLLRPSAL
jgi:hypothetical protein